jgi:hypothetical protein
MNPRSIRRLPRAASLALLAACAAAPSLARAEDAPAAPAAPDAPPAAKSNAANKRWLLEMTHGPLRRVLVDDGTGHDRTYAYMTMTVENKTGLPRPWRPLVTATVDTRTAPYVAGGFSEALDPIRRQEHNRFLDPLPDSGFKAGDEAKLADGKKLTLVAIFGPVDAGWAKLRVEVTGLMSASATLKVEKYGERQVVVESAYADRNAKVMQALRAEAKASGSELPKPTAEYQVVSEIRRFVMEFRREGDEFRPDDDPIEFVGERWEVPETVVILPDTKPQPNPKVLTRIPAGG